MPAPNRSFLLITTKKKKSTMKTTDTHCTEIPEIMQVLMNQGMQGFPEVMARMYNLAMQFEREKHLDAGKYERSEERTGYANGYKPKTLKTHVGELKLQIPQVRDSDSPFYPKSLERGCRFDRALKLAVAEMYIKGISTRKVQAVFNQRGGCGYSLGFQCCKPRRSSTPAKHNYREIFENAT